MTKISVDKAAILRQAWFLARHAAVLTGEPLRSRIGPAMRAAWALAKSAVSATVPQPVQQQQADASQGARAPRFTERYAIVDGVVLFGGNTRTAVVKEHRHGGRILIAERLSQKYPGWLVLIDLDLLAGKPAPVGFEHNRSRSLRTGYVDINATEDFEKVLSAVEAYALGSPAALRGAATRRKNAGTGISQSGISGSPRQRQWAAEIRGAMQRAAGGDAGFAALVAAADQAKFWIDNRKASWSDLAARYGRAKVRNDAAVEEVRGVLLGTSTVSPEQSRRCDELVAIQRELDRFLGR